jgi:hypothetical protein
MRGWFFDGKVSELQGRPRRPECRACCSAQRWRQRDLWFGILDGGFQLGVWATRSVPDFGEFRMEEINNNVCMYFLHYDYETIYKYNKVGHSHKKSRSTVRGFAVNSALLCCGVSGLAFPYTLVAILV